MKRDLGSLPPRVAAAMAAARGVFTILGNGKIATVIIPGRSGDA